MQSNTFFVLYYYMNTTHKKIQTSKRNLFCHYGYEYGVAPVGRLQD